MKINKIFLLFIFLLIQKALYANIDAIKIDEIDLPINTKKDLQWLYDNQYLFVNWTPSWNYDITKEKVKKRLISVYQQVIEIKTNNPENSLLLGDLAHYLYNLEQEEYFEKAVNHYNKAWKEAPSDYRCPWFLAYHYAQGARPDSSIPLFKKAELLLPDTDKNALFWEEYALSCHSAGMPSHVKYAIKKANSILGEECALSKLLSDIINAALVKPNQDSIYKDNEIWEVNKSTDILFVSRPLGVKFSLDTVYNLYLSGYKNRAAMISFCPPKVKGNNNSEITYTIALMFYLPEKGHTLENYVENIIKGFPKPRVMNYKSKFGNAVAYEIIDPKQYPEQGGGHFIVIGYERQATEDPGLLLENPSIVLKSENKIQYYRLKQKLTKFQDKLYYVFMLDTCERIYDSSLLELQNFIENNIVIE